MSAKADAVEASGDEARSFRSLQFWGRAGSIWAGYKLAQAQAQWMRLRGHSEEHIKEAHWAPHADRAGRDMHALCVDMRGFFIKVLTLLCFCINRIVHFSRPVSVALPVRAQASCTQQRPRPFL